MTKKYSDFKIISIILVAILIFFTVSYFKFLPFSIINLDTNSIDHNILSFYFMLSELVAVLLSVIFVLIYSKKTDKQLKERYKSISIGLGVIIFYFIFPYFQVVPFKLLGTDTSNIPLTLEIIYLIAYSALMGAIMGIIYHKRLEKDWKKFKKNSTKLFIDSLKPWFIALFIMVTSNLIIQLVFKNGIAGNEQSIRDTLKISPIYIFFSAVIYAPVVEELVFRLSIRNIFTNKWVFIMISGILFGSLHVITNINNLSDLLYIIPYSAPGIAFAYLLQKHDNILVPMSFHLIHNGIIVSFLTLLELL